MKDREHFLREDLKTYKKKFILLCQNCEVGEKLYNKFGDLKTNPYICKQIEIKKI